MTLDTQFHLSGQTFSLSMVVAILLAGLSSLTPLHAADAESKPKLLFKKGARLAMVGDSG